MDKNFLNKYTALPKYIIDLYTTFLEYNMHFNKEKINIHYFNILNQYSNYINNYIKNIDITNIYINNFLNAQVVGSNYLFDYGYNCEYFMNIYNVLFSAYYELNNDLLKELIEILNNDSIDKFARIAFVFQIIQNKKIFGDYSVLLLPIIFNNFMYYNDNSYNNAFVFLNKILINYEEFNENSHKRFDEWMFYFGSILNDEIMYNINHINIYNELIYKTKKKLSSIINNNQKEKILQFLFEHVKFNVEDFSKYLEVTRGQGIRYLNKFLENNIISKNNKQRDCEYTFIDLYNYINKKRDDII